jgi:cell cycle checkpoint protein
MLFSVGHPLIQLGYAYEMDSKEIAMDGLGMAAVQYNFLHKYLDDKSYTKPSSLSSTSPLELLQKLSKDKRLPKGPDLEGLEKYLDKHESVVLEYWNGWTIDDPLKQFELSQEAAVALLVATVRPGTHAFNFLIVHLLTTSHAVRILLPFIPAEYHITLVRQWWLLVLAIYMVKDRPLADPDNVEKDLKGKHWHYVEGKALNSPWCKDAHYVKGKLPL